LSSLAIIFPNADLPDQIDLPLNFHAAAIIGLIRLAARGEQPTIHGTILLRLYPISLQDGVKTKIKYTS
jgi:hypothetical protein